MIRGKYSLKSDIYRQKLTSRFTVLESKNKRLLVSVIVKNLLKMIFISL